MAAASKMYVSNRLTLNREAHQAQYGSEGSKEGCVCSCLHVCVCLCVSACVHVRMCVCACVRYSWSYILLYYDLYKTRVQELA